MSFKKIIKKVLVTMLSLSIIAGSGMQVPLTVSAGSENTGAWGDLGNGYYNNPVLPADYSDPDIIRVGEDYYLITSTFVQSPGITVLHSVDLVNWEIIGGAVKDLTQITPDHNYTVMNTYGRGIWAPCLSYNPANERFYIHFGDPDYGMYMVYTDDIYGEWSDVYEVVLPDGSGFIEGWNDCGMLWDDDGQGYFAATHFADGYKDYIFKISQDGYHLEDTGVLVHQTDDGLYSGAERNPEALKLFKKDGLYYFFHNGITGGNRKAFIMRSSSIYGNHADGSEGTFENPGKYEHIPYPIVEGTREPNQGNLIDIQADDGSIKWFFWTHQGSTDLDGRPNSLIPVTWNSDGWPVAGYEDKKAAGSMIWENIEKPIKDSEIKRPQTSDDFDSEEMALQWMWNYQPREGFWSLSERPGHLRLKAFKPLRTDTLNKAGNSLIQRMYRTEGNVVKTKMDVSNMADGQFAGLLYMMGSAAAGIGVYRENGVNYIRFKGDSDSIGDVIPDDITDVYIKSEWENEMLARSYYSLDGITYVQFGEEYQIRKSNYRGGHIGFFCYNNLSESGYVDFDYLHYEMDVNEEPPVIMGVDEGGVYDLPVTLRYSRGNATVNGEAVQSGDKISGEGTYVVRVEDNGMVSEKEFTLTEDAVDPGITVPFAMNVGGGAVDNFTKDMKYRDEYWGALNGTITEYDGEGVYKTGREAKTLSMQFDGIPFGYYKVKLHFIENEATAAGERVIDVILQNQSKGDVDIFAEAGANAPLVKEFDGIEIDGTLKVELESIAGEAMLCGIEIEEGNEPEKTPRPQLVMGEILLGTQNGNTVSPETFDSYTINASEWSGVLTDITIAPVDMPASNCGAQPVSGNAISFKKAAAALRAFSEPIKSGQVVFSADYAQGTRIKSISLVDSSGNQVVKIGYDLDTTGAKENNILYVNGESVLLSYMLSSRTEQMSVKDMIIDVDEGTISYTVSYSKREGGSNNWVTESNIIEDIRIRDIAGLLISGEDAGYAGYVDNVVLYSKVPGEAEPDQPTDTPSSPEPVEDTNLLAWYKFDGEYEGGHAVDYSGANKHGTIYGGTSFVTGKRGKALSLDGSNGYVKLPENLFEGNTDFTIAAWMNCADASTRNQWLFGFGTDSNQYMFYTALDSTRKPKFAATVSGYSREQQLPSATDASFNTWQHVAVTKNGNVATLYLNGEVVAENTAFTHSPASMKLTQNYIGKSHFSSDPYFKGSVDDFVVYGEGKTQAQIKLLMNGDLPKEGEVSIPTPRPQPEYNVSINPLSKGVDINRDMIGLFFEDINFSADGGLYAEMIKNRSFEFFGADGSKNSASADLSMDFWTVTKNTGCTAQYSIKTDDPIHANNTKYISMDISAAGDGISLQNTGFNGISLKKGEEYNFSVFARSADYSGEYSISVVKDGTVYAEASAAAAFTEEWAKHELSFTANADVDNGVFVLTLKGTGKADLDMISLFPANTYNNRENGLRADLVEVLKDINPGFLRFPGGCIIEGYNLENRYNWKDTVGPVEERKVNWSRWQNTISGRHFSDYFQSNGLGFYEYFLLCEDLECEPIPVVNCGMSCQYQSPKEVVPIEEMDEYIQDALDLIEFANGGTDTEWGALRASMGHPEPFNLKYIGIGNEQWYQDYFDRYELFREAFAEKYPEIKLITTSGPDPSGSKYDYAWDIFNTKDETYAYAVDEHYYQTPQWFFENVNRYDNYERNGIKIFAGEFAAHATSSQPRPNSMYTALSEAAFMTGLERNADLVQLASYAPLLAKVDNWQWTPDMIWFTNSSVYLTPNYYVQKMYANNMGDYTVSNEVTSSDPDAPSTLYTTVSYDEVNGDIIVKAVNSADSKIKVTFDINSDVKVRNNGKVTLLYAEDPEAANTLENPEVIKEQEFVYNEFSNEFTYELEENSFTVFRIPVDHGNDYNVAAALNASTAKSSISATAQIRNNTADAKTVTTYLAVYSEDGALIQVDSAEATIEVMESADVVIEKEIPGNAHEAKLYIWENMKPIYMESKILD